MLILKMHLVLLQDASGAYAVGPGALEIISILIETGFSTSLIDYTVSSKIHIFNKLDVL